MHAKTRDEIQQKFEWRARLVVDLLSRKFEISTLAIMLEAGLRQAHSEGLLDAADVCETVSLSAENADKRRAAKVLAESIRELDRRNKAIPGGEYSTLGHKNKPDDR